MDSEKLKNFFEKAKKISKIVFIIVLFLSMIPSGILFGLGLRQRKTCTEKVSAVVTDFKEWDRVVENENGRERDISYTPVFTYTYNGETYSSSTRSYSSDKNYEIGEETEIRIDPDSPEKIMDPKDKNYFSTALFMLIWPFFVTVGFLVLWTMFFGGNSNLTKHIK